MINIAGKLISNKVNNIRFFLNYPKIDIEEERLYVQGITQTMASMDEMFKKHYEAIPKLIDQKIKTLTNG